MVREADDAQDTVAWLREQPWFSGDLATMGMSYVAYTQWALLADPPPELRASVMVAGPHDFGEAIWENGPFALETYLGWSDRNTVPFENRPSAVRQLTGNRQVEKRERAAFAGLPLAAAAESLLNTGAPWYREWLDHPVLADPFWRRYDFTDALQRVQTPTLLIGGWQDVFLGQTVRQYETLRSRGGRRRADARAVDACRPRAQGIGRDRQRGPGLAGHAPGQAGTGPARPAGPHVRHRSQRLARRGRVAADRHRDHLGVGSPAAGGTALRGRPGVRRKLPGLRHAYSQHRSGHLRPYQLRVNGHPCSVKGSSRRANRYPRIDCPWLRPCEDARVTL